MTETPTLRTRTRYRIPGLDGEWEMRGLQTTDMGADGRAQIDLWRVDPETPRPDGDVEAVWQLADKRAKELAELQAAYKQACNERDRWRARASRELAIAERDELQRRLDEAIERDQAGIVAHNKTLAERDALIRLRDAAVAWLDSGFEEDYDALVAAVDALPVDGKDGT